MDAVRQLLTTAREKRWCVKYGCTTCGAFEFRDTVAANAGEILDALKTLRIGDLYAEFPGGDVHDGFELLMSEVTRPLGLWLRLGRLPRVELRGTEVGARLERRDRAFAATMKASAERRAARQLREGPEAVAERRRVKREAADARHAMRLAMKAEREHAQQLAVEAIGALEPVEVIRALGERRSHLPLYRLSDDLIARVVQTLGTISDLELLQLREAVPTTRVRPLSRLSGAIDGERRRRAAASEGAAGG
jgi:hypothetical protein